ncbi:Telomeric repeat-binding factor 2-interacting protein 1 [Parachaetomium inaequale]|uniref:Telomeric repeat-binding factor 2-interacting protein 1 n=1 Tax=Parachaetomium inaequale TaxID=2588326 RepID=A0AAN6PC25_9PEZI|nr:Telomeric repeat-binding factor 2-interacting protein 1 [Parachaetomium inaequale]
MAPPIVYDGVNGRYEGTLFNGIKFWVSQLVPTRSVFVDKIKDNGGKIALLEKFADVLIADHARKGCPAGSVSWRYIDDCLAKGELVNIEEHRIHAANSTRPPKGIKVPYTKLDEQILVTWVRQSDDVSGNEIYKKLAERYPQHSWQSWRDKWVNKMSRLPEENLPPSLPELPPPRPQPGGGPRATPDTAAPARAAPAKAAPARAAPARAAPARPDATPASRGSRDLVKKTRIRFTEEDDKLLTEYVADRVRAGKGPNGNEIYKDLEEEHPHHSWHSWRDRWVRHLSLRSAEDESEEEPARPQAEPIQPREAPSERPRPQARGAISPPPARTPAQPPPPSAAAAPTPGPSVNGLLMSRKQEFDHKKKRSEAARTIQAVWRGHRVRRDLRHSQPCIAAFQARAQGFRARRALNPAEIESEPVDTPSSPVTGQGPADETTMAMEPEPEPEPDRGQEKDADPAIFRAAEHYGDEDRHHTSQPASTTPEETTPLLPDEEFWPHFEEYNKNKGIMPGPWAQIGDRAVDFRDLWRCATAEPDHASRDWEVVAEELGFDWIAEPHVPVHLKMAFEKHLRGFEDSMLKFYLSDEGRDASEEDSEETEASGDEGEEGDGGDEEVQEVDEEGDEEEEGEEGDEEMQEVVEEENEEDERDEEEGGDQEIQDMDEKSDEAEEDVDEETASEASGTNFVSSPPIVSLKRARMSSLSPFLGSVRKRPRRDPSSEVPETPQTRTERAGQGVAGARAVAANQHTPTRPRHAQPAGQRVELKTQVSQPPGQYDGTDDDGLVTPSQQLRSEMEAASSPPEPPRNAPRIPSSASHPLPSVERDDDETSDSSDGFEPVSALPVRGLRHPNPPRGRDENRPHRTLPWSKDKGKQPATILTSTPNPAPRTSTRTTPLINTPHQPPRTSTKTTTLRVPSARTSTHPTPNHNHHSTSARKPPKQHEPLDPAPLMKHLHTQHPTCPQALIVRAVKATTCQFANAEAVLDSLVRGRGIPAKISGVWTREDDELLRGIDKWVAGLGGREPPKKPLGGGADGERLGEMEWRKEKEGEKEVYWRLAGKHGSEGVFRRREFLWAWDHA